jgi:hypothetical protein
MHSAMNRFLVLFLLGVIPCFLHGQSYSYISDRNFWSVETLIGYDFRPGELEVPEKNIKKTIPPGQYSFGITQRYLYVSGPEIKGVYDVNSINTTEYGYILTTINARDARLKGQLKVILNKYSQVEALVFRRSPQEPEMIFFLKTISKSLRDKETAFFTDWDELVVSEPDSLWGHTMYPFFRIHLQEGVQERLAGADSTMISFVEEITIEEKTKVEEIENPDAPEEAAVETDTVVVKTKEIITHYVVLRSILKYDDGTAADKTWRFPIKRIVEREDKYAKADEDKYEWELKNEDGDDILLYLNGNKAITAIQIEGKKYLVRGY